MGLRIKERKTVVRVLTFGRDKRCILLNQNIFFRLEN
jgi:hypothetical protein